MTAMANASSSLPFLVLLLHFLSLFSGQILGATGSCNSDDKSGLLGFKSAVTADPKGFLGTWERTTDCCTSWTGVFCDANSRVTSVSIYGDPSDPSSVLTGTIPLSLSKLQELNRVSFDNLRNLTGPFPAALLHLPNLTHISIVNAQISGELPADIAARLPKLVELRLSKNLLYGYPLPLLAGLNSLVNLLLDDNSFAGDIPSELVTKTNFKNLGKLQLDGNSFNGQLPDLTPMTNLQILTLSGNQFRGPIPALPKQLMILHLADNSFSGSIPAQLGDLADMDSLDLSANSLRGSVPPSFRNFHRVYNLNLSMNILGGPFPDLTSTLLTALDLSDNVFEIGRIPTWVEKLPTIYKLRLRGCGIAMRLAEDFNPVGPLYYLDLSRNSITGTATMLLARAKKITELNLSGNKLAFDMRKLKLPATLKSLNISDNLVSGRLPPDISRLEKLDVSNNQLCGPIPSSKFLASAFAKNKCLCGSPLGPCSRRA